MGIELFISTLVVCAIATSVGIECIKDALTYFGIKYKSIVVATITSMAVGFGEAIAFFCVNGIAIGVTQIVYAICMGIANTLVSAIGYDKVKAFILALVGKNEE